jgi:hypothetical protein
MNIHKQAAFNYLADRAHNINITKDEREKEMEQTNAIAKTMAALVITTNLTRSIRE